MRRFIGIDVGISGALAMVDHHGELQAVADMPLAVVGKTGRHQIVAAGVADILRSWAEGHSDEVCVGIERTQARPSIKDKGGESRTLSASTGFSLGLSYGIIQGVVAALRYPAVFIDPKTWKTIYRLGSDKEESRAMALQLYPAHVEKIGRKKDHGRAESILIARYVSQHGPWS